MGYLRRESQQSFEKGLDVITAHLSIVYVFRLGCVCVLGLDVSRNCLHPKGAHAHANPQLLLALDQLLECGQGPRGHGNGHGQQILLISVAVPAVPLLPLLLVCQQLFGLLGATSLEGPLLGLASRWLRVRVLVC